MINPSELAKQKIEFWFDPVCPWTWITSRWMTEVDNKLGLHVEWHPFSLKVLNENNPNNNYKEWHDHGHIMGQILMDVKNDLGNQKVAELYRALGTRLHPQKREDAQTVVRESLNEVGLAVGLYETAQNADNDNALRQSTKRGLDLVGPDVGVPIIAIDEKAFFGPVVSPAPKGVDALNLWQAVSLSITTPGFSELKRGRTSGLDYR